MRRGYSSSGRRVEDLRPPASGTEPGRYEGGGGHEHHVGCAFGSPDCPEFATPPPPEYRGLFGRKARRRCPHSWLDPVWGDRVNDCGGWRLWCRGCRRFLDGPVGLASKRRDEGR